MNKETMNSLGIPLAIVVAGALVAGSVVFSGKGESNVVAQVDPTPTVQPAAPQPTGSLDAIAPVTKADHIKGNPNAAVMIVEFSDFECPFCKRFHGTMNQIIDEYGTDGEVAWVFRQFPLDQLHPVKAREEALASECAADQGGNDAFWNYADRMFELTQTNNRTDIETVIPQIAEELELDMNAFQLCMENDKFGADIEADITDAVATGGRGTPWSVVIAPNGTKYPINGAQTYESVKQIIEVALQQ